MLEETRGTEMSMLYGVTALGGLFQWRDTRHRGHVSQSALAWRLAWEHGSPDDLMWSDL